jgi:hypothetical protein
MATHSEAEIDALADAVVLAVERASSGEVAAAG